MFWKNKPVNSQHTSVLGLPRDGKHTVTSVGLKSFNSYTAHKHLPPPQFHSLSHGTGIFRHTWNAREVVLLLTELKKNEILPSAEKWTELEALLARERSQA